MKGLALLLAASLLLYPFAAFSADYGSQTSQNQQVPPVAQPLVREGDFAVQLATRLNLGFPEDEASAEDMLTQAGIFPANGWISDYPVTPQIVGQLSDSAASAADAGKLPMSADEARNHVLALAAEMDLPLPSVPEGQLPPGQPSPSAGTVPPDANYNYYYDQGPPIITYFPPPAAYGYLYDWVPYPAIWFGYSFPGFYICHSFTTVVPRTPYGPGHRYFHGGVVTNHVIDPATRSEAHLAPVVPMDQGRARPETMLRTESGRTFRNMSEFRHESARTSPDVRPSLPGNGSIKEHHSNAAPGGLPAMPGGRRNAPPPANIPERRSTPNIPHAVAPPSPAPVLPGGNSSTAPPAHIPRSPAAPSVPRAAAPANPVPAPSNPAPSRSMPSGPVLSGPGSASRGNSAAGVPAPSGGSIGRGAGGGFGGHGRR